MSLETAVKILSTPSQTVTPTDKMAATAEQQTASAKASESTTGTVDPIPATETKEVAPVKKEETASAKFSALAKREKALMKMQSDIKTKESTFTTREAELAKREAAIKESEELWESDVFGALEKRGYSYNKLTEMMLDGKKVEAITDPVKLAQKTIDDFKKEQAAKETKAKEETEKLSKAAKDKQDADLAAAWDNYRTEVNEFIDANENEFELIKLYEQQGLIIDTVQEFFEANKRVLSVKEASEMVENYLLSEAEKASKAKKVKDKWGIKESGAPKSDGKKDEGEPKITKTLNNSMQPTSASVLPAASEADRMKRAMAALESQRK